MVLDDNFIRSRTDIYFGFSMKPSLLTQLHLCLIISLIIYLLKVKTIKSIINGDTLKF